MQIVIAWRGEELDTLASDLATRTKRLLEQGADGR